MSFMQPQELHLTSIIFPNPVGVIMYEKLPPVVEKNSLPK